MLRTIVDQDADRTIDCQLQENDPGSLVAARLRRSGYPLLSSVQCDVREGVACLTGMVPTFHLKQIAQELASHTPGVWQVNNRLHVPTLTHRVRRSAK
jgi:osmotically-inducible protein OsmY